MRWDQLAEVETNNLLLTSVAGREGSASASRLGTRMSVHWEYTDLGIPLSFDSIGLVPSPASRLAWNLNE